MGNAGHPHAIFRRSIAVGDVFQALAAAHELPTLTLRDALDLTLLLSKYADGLYDRARERWVDRLRGEVSSIVDADVELARAALAALPVRAELGGHLLAELFDLHARHDLAEAVDGWLERVAG